MHSCFYTMRNKLPEAICCCLRTFYPYVVLSELPYVCTPTFIATIANIGIFSDRLPKAICCCLHKPIRLMMRC